MKSGKRNYQLRNTVEIYLERMVENKEKWRKVCGKG